MAGARAARLWASAAVLVLSRGAAAETHLESDARVVFVLGDDDVLHSSAESVPASPGPGIGDRPGYRLWFDGYGAPDTGRENRLDLTLGAAAPGYLPGLETRASLRLSLDWQRLAGNGGGAFRDEGTFIEVSVEAGARFGVTVFPIDTNGFRLSSLDELAWGGTRASRGESIFPGAEGNVPGARAFLETARVRAFAGFKTASIEEVVPGSVPVSETNWGFLGGIDVDIVPFLELGVQGGYFEQGRLEQPGVEGRLAYSAGGTARLVLHRGRRVPSLPLFFGEPLTASGAEARLDGSERAIGPIAYALALEATALWQRLQAFEALDATRLQPARAAALYGSLHTGAVETRLAALYREPSFVLRNGPSLPRFSTIPEALAQGPELSLSAGVTLRPERWLLVPSLDLGLRLPATLGTPSAPDQFGQETAQTLVVAGPNRLEPLEPGAFEVPVFHGRLGLLLRASEQVSALVWLAYRRDNNATRLELDPAGLARGRRFIRPDFAGGGLALGARF
jgi:hypothetical protein